MTGAEKCGACPPGSFQSSAGKSSCAPCTSGKYSSSPASTACAQCPRGYSSKEGSPSCSGIADKGYFILEGSSVDCPSNSLCAGGTQMPRPLRGYWVDRSSLKFAKQVFKCPRDTCAPQGSQDGRRLNKVANASGCWEESRYGERDADNHICNPDKLLCVDGANSVLCGSCDAEFIYSSAERVCVSCGVATVRSMVAVGCALFVSVGIAAMYLSGAHRRIPAGARKSRVVQFLAQVDSGALRVMWANFQVSVQSSI
jgi:hypothetical protein